MTIKNPLIAEIANKVWCINEFGMDSIFVIEGADRALVIDTGTGVCDLPAVIASITNKPYDLALTHGHTDHAGGIGWFKNIFLHPADFDMAKNVSVKSRQGFAGRLIAMSDGLFDVTLDSVIEFDSTPEMTAIGEGYVFDLGNRHVKVYETPGHTPGGLSFLIEEERIIITGDACNTNTLMFKNDINVLLKTARRIDELSPLYDRNYNGHIGFGPVIDFTPMAESLTRDMIDMCEKLLAGNYEYEMAPGDFAGTVAIARCATCRVQFDPAHLK